MPTKNNIAAIIVSVNFDLVLFIIIQWNIIEKTWQFNFTEYILHLNIQDMVNFLTNSLIFILFIYYSILRDNPLNIGI